MDADESGAPVTRSLADYLTRFPCPLAAANGGTAASWNLQGVDSLATALELVYERDRRCQLTMKTVRSHEGLNPRGLPVATTADLLSNFLSRNELVIEPNRRTFAQEHPTARLERYESIQRAADDAVRLPVTVFCDGTPSTGQRLDALGLSVLELPWHAGATVLCVGVPDLIDHLTLHTATPEDLP